MSMRNLMSSKIHLRHQRRPSGSSGQIMVLFAVSIAVMLAVAALVIDLGLLRADRAKLQNALDAGALAAVHGGLITGANVSTSRNDANRYVEQNFSGVKPKTIAYKCLVGRDPLTGGPRITDMPAGCNVSSPVAGSAWTCAPGTCWIECDPSLPGNSCNTVVLTADVTRGFVFGPAVKVDSGNTGTVMSAACAGLCGQTVTYGGALDVVVIIDRSGSMWSGSGGDGGGDGGGDSGDNGNHNGGGDHGGGDHGGGGGNHGGGGANAPTGAAANCVAPSATELQNDPDVAELRKATCAFLMTLDPASQHVAMSFLGASTEPASPSCPSTASGGLGFAGPDEYPAGLNEWIPVKLSGSYKSGGQLDFASAPVLSVSCFDSSSVGTNLASPLNVARRYLYDLKDGKAHAIVLETDGAPNKKDATFNTDSACKDAHEAARLAKADGIELYVVGYGVDDSNHANCGSNADFSDAKDLLSKMATGPNIGTPCAADENTDGDHFFCQPKGEDLQLIFQRIATELGTAKGRLIQLYAQPEVDSVSGCTSATGACWVTITGRNFMDVSAVVFGSASAGQIITRSDTEIVATAPAGTPGQRVEVVVSTPGGSSEKRPAKDTFTYP